MAELYELDGERIVPTAYTAGPWSERLQHGGPPAALLARALAPDEEDGRAAARITFDILRPIPVAPLRIDTEVLRCGLAGACGSSPRRSRWPRTAPS